MNPYGKAPFSYTLYGLLDHGVLDQAVVLDNASVRDVTRANTFAEAYSNGTFPSPEGVRPSLFGDLTLIDLVWIKNGYRMDQGWPNLVRLTSSAGDMSGLRLQGKELNIFLAPSNQWVYLSGGFVVDSRACRQIQVPLGQPVPISRALYDLTCAASWFREASRSRCFNRHLHIARCGGHVVEEPKEAGRPGIGRHRAQPGACRASHVPPQPGLVEVP